ncbi:MAG: hypothetical protein JSW51_05385 [Gemmatimonadota bacterium]|nr:MAG: hypothetical protein JSW51_05385 [Gemmatimonadota bacterium]
MIEVKRVYVYGYGYHYDVVVNGQMVERFERKYQATESAADYAAMIEQEMKR